MQIFQRKFGLACIALLLSACGGRNDDLPLAFSATLTGAEEVPSNASPASGIGLVTVDPDRRTITAIVITSGMADTDARIHEAPPRAAGPMVFPLAKAPGTIVWSTRSALTREQLSALKNGDYYFNVYSTSFPAGEIRGQIVWTLPSPSQLSQLHGVRHQSALLDQQLADVEEIEDGHASGVGIGFHIGF